MMTLNTKSSFGIASARHCTCVRRPGEKYVLDVPLGMSVCRWDTKTAKRSLFFQAHSDAIMGMRASPDNKWIATASYGGEVKLWSMDWKLLATQQTPTESVSYVGWSSNSSTFFTTTNGFQSYLTCYQVVTSSSDVTVKLLWNATPSSNVTKGKKPIQEQHLSPAKAYKYGNVFSACESTNSGNCIVLEEKDDENDLIYLFSNTGTMLHSQEVTAKSKQKKSEILALSSIKDGVCAISLQGGTIVMLNSETLETISSFETGFSSRTLTWDGDNIVLPASSGKRITWWSRMGQLIYQFSDLPTDDYIVCVQLGLDQPVLWVCGVASLVCLSLVKNNEGIIQSANVAHKIPTTQEISCCGLALSPDLTRVAVGDMAGNVWVYCLGETPPRHHHNIEISVRCIIWSDNGTILIGDLGGNIYKWNIAGSFGLWATLEGSVIHIRQSHNKKFTAVGTSKGVLAMYESDLSIPVISLPAHSPVEIWSICWSPLDDKVATCSEDQSTKVWQCKDWKELAVLKGHTMAVTSVDWSIINGQSLLASCSDDQTVRLYSGETLELQQVLSAAGLIHGWFTLTYLKFYNEGKMLCVTTQNGHLVVWKFGTAQSASMEYHGRIHGGSIEGLDIGHTEPLVTTCSADCVVHVVSIS